MRALLLALLLAPAARASDMSQPGTGPGTAVVTSTLTISGAGTACFTAGAFSINCASGSFSASSGTMTGRLTAPDATITYGLTAATASISGSLTASSGTALVNFGVKNQGYMRFSPDGTEGYLGFIRHSATDMEMLTSGYSTPIKFDASKYIFGGTAGGSVGIGTASPGTTLDVNGNAQFGSGVNKSTFSATGGLAVPYGIVASTFQAGAIGYGLNANPGTTQGLASSGGHTLLRANTGSVVYVQNAAGTTFASFDATNTTLNGVVVMSATASPASGAACTAGTITWDASYIYVCTASGAWKRSALTGGY